MRVTLVLPDPDAAPNAWTRRSLELRNAATITGRCSECGGRRHDYGIDHREITHAQLHHNPGCRCGDETIRAHLGDQGLAIAEDSYIILVVEVDGRDADVLQQRRWDGAA